MSMLGLRTLPVNHRLHPVYRGVGAVVGLLLVAFAVVGFVVSGDVLGAPASTAFCAICLVAGVVMILAAVQGGNVAAEVNAYLDASMADVVILFVAGVAALAAGFYGRVGEPVH